MFDALGARSFVKKSVDVLMLPAVPANWHLIGPESNPNNILTITIMDGPLLTKE